MNLWLRLHWDGQAESHNEHGNEDGIPSQFILPLIEMPSLSLESSHVKHGTPSQEYHSRPCHHVFLSVHPSKNGTG